VTGARPIMLNLAGGCAWHEPDLSRSARVPRAVGPGLSRGAPCVSPDQDFPGVEGCRENRTLTISLRIPGVAAGPGEGGG
jgi:hypothetical protein